MEKLGRWEEERRRRRKGTRNEREEDGLGEDE